MTKPTAAQFTALRERLGLTISELASWLDAAPGTVRQWERAERPINALAFELMQIEAGEHSRYCLRAEFAEPEPEPELVEPATVRRAGLLEDLERLLEPHRQAAKNRRAAL